MLLFSNMDNTPEYIIYQHLYDKIYDFYIILLTNLVKDLNNSQTSAFGLLCKYTKGNIKLFDYFVATFYKTNILEKIKFVLSVTIDGDKYKKASYSNLDVIIYCDNKGLNFNDLETMVCRYCPYLSIIKHIINKKSQLNKVNRHMNTPFMVACKYNKNLDIVKYLKCANIEHKNYYGYDVLFLATVFNTSLPIVKYLTKLGLVYNGSLGCVKSVEILIFYIKILNYDVLYVDSAEYNVLMIAILHNNNINVLKYLIENYYFNPMKTNKEGETIFDIVLHKDKQEFVKYIYNSFDTVYMPPIIYNKLKNITIAYETIRDRQMLTKFLFHDSFSNMSKMSTITTLIKVNKNIICVGTSTFHHPWFFTCSKRKRNIQYHENAQNETYKQCSQFLTNDVAQIIAQYVYIDLFSCQNNLTNI